MVPILVSPGGGPPAMLRPCGAGARRPGPREDATVSFMKRAQDMAKGAAEQAQIAAGQAKVKAGEAASVANQRAADPATQERLGKSAREAMGLARRGVTTVVERIDPGTLAEVVIKATALQEMTNAALRRK